MKNQLVVVVCALLFAFGCRQCATDALNGFDSSWYNGQPNAFGDPSALFAPRIYSSALPAVPGLDGSGGYISQVADASANNAYSLNSFGASPYDLQNPTPMPMPMPWGLENIFHKILHVIKTIIFWILIVSKKILFLPLIVIKVLLWPVTLLFRGGLFFLKLVFLPVTVTWRIIKMILYPIKVMLRHLIWGYGPTPYVASASVYGI